MYHSMHTSMQNDNRKLLINMGTHPINLAVRFLLEMAALISLGVWGWKVGDSWTRYILAIGIPLILAVGWGTFAVPDDPSRSGSAPVPVPGIIRLLLELGFFSVAFGRCWKWDIPELDGFSQSL